MAPQKILPGAILLLSMLASGCSPDSPLSILVSPPDVGISQVQYLPSAPGEFAKSTFTVTNTGGGATAFNIGVQVTFKSGNFIVARNAAGIGTLVQGESIRGEVWFTELPQPGAFDKADYLVWWYDAQGTYYDKEIIDP